MAAQVEKNQILKGLDIQDFKYLAGGVHKADHF